MKKYAKPIIKITPLSARLCRKVCSASKIELPGGGEIGEETVDSWD